MIYTFLYALYFIIGFVFIVNVLISERRPTKTLAALSGVDVRIMIPEKSDNIVVKWSIRSYFQEMLEAGVQIYLYKDSFMHSKTIVADDSVSSVGTANLDVRSFEQTLR